jgi:hypothetical protein
MKQRPIVNFENQSLQLLGKAGESLQITTLVALMVMVLELSNP